MKFWPSDHFEIESTLSPEALATGLKSVVRPKKVFNFNTLFFRSTDPHLFHGQVFFDGFKITRIIQSRNSFPPAISGRFLRSDSGTKIIVRMGLDLYSIAFMYFWLACLGFMMFRISVDLIMELINGHMHNPLVVLAPIMMMAFGRLIVSAAFWPEAEKQKQMLIELFKTLETNDAST